MSFANPIWLYGLLGISIPILIHLWSKREGKTIKVGSIKFFPEGETRQSRRLYPNEFLLLAIRSLLVAFLVMLIAQPLIIGKKKKDRVAVIIDSALIDQGFDSVLDTLVSGNYDLRLLQNKLPEFDPEDEISVSSSSSDFWGLVDDIETLDSDKVFVFSMASLSSFKGRKPSTSKELTWYTVPVKQDRSLVLKAIVNNGINYITVGEFGEEKTEINVLKSANIGDFPTIEIRGNQVKHRNQESWVEIQTASPIFVRITADPEFELDAQIWEAAFRAIEETNGFPINILNEQTKSADIELWLTNKTITSQESSQTLILKQDPVEKSLITASDKLGVYYISRQLSLENVTSENISEELLKTLWMDKELSSAIARNDQRALKSASVQPVFNSGKSKATRAATGIDALYWMGFLSLLALERFISFKRNQ